jgi:[ribosomal protein S5]-alanine N-acetyltransferase
MAQDRHWRISTRRLDLIQLSMQEIQALVEGDPEPTERLLDATFRKPYAPPPLMDDALPFICGWLHDHPGDLWWQPWFFADRAQREIVGSAGFSGPSESGSLQLGYAVYPDYQGRGYATEVAASLLQAAWTDPRITAVQATIPPWHSQSIRVAEKTGMITVGEGEDDDVGKIVIYEIRRARKSSDAGPRPRQPESGPPCPSVQDRVR